MKLSIVLSRFVKNFAGILMGIALNWQIAFGKIVIFTMLILPTQERAQSGSEDAGLYGVWQLKTEENCVPGSLP